MAGGICRRKVRREGRLHPMRARYGMLARLAKGAGLAAVGLALIVGQGCKKKQAPAPEQPVVRTVPRPAPPDFPDDPPPEPLVADKGTHHPVRRAAAPVVVPVVQPVVDLDALAEAQRQRDASLLQRQQAASQRQQQELNGVVERSAKIRQAQQDEPRIQEAPEAPINQPLPGVPGQRIQDNPTAPMQEAEPEEPASPEGNAEPDQTPAQPQPQR
ncbi:hypothetical protein [Tunturibacter empetritectus]|uniref:Uncharacterized protein n=1 Tax=Tunturiibacter empetritectus TaxID=3069691 RepID=A0A7W8IHG5_9BACT|nr:hypothetical protein [Edaphobacter lichenicola]MBB5316328.1 hypothetical protein [Edaphobacter lichenicola]